MIRMKLSIVVRLKVIKEKKLSDRRAKAKELETKLRLIRGTLQSFTDLIKLSLLANTLSIFSKIETTKFNKKV